ncbi:hypothetical protein Tco_1187771 [Tanacetum coccineum]
MDFSGRSSDISLVELENNTVKEDDRATLLEGGVFQAASPASHSSSITSPVFRSRRSSIVDCYFVRIFLIMHLKQDMKLSYLAHELISTYRLAPQSCIMTDSSMNNLVHLAGRLAPSYVLSRALNVPMLFTSHSLGRDKLKQILKQGRQSQDDINQTYRIMRRIEAEEITVDASEVIPPGMEFKHIVQQGGGIDDDSKRHQDGLTTPNPPVWSEQRSHESQAPLVALDGNSLALAEERSNPTGSSTKGKLDRHIGFRLLHTTSTYCERLSGKRRLSELPAQSALSVNEHPHTIIWIELLKGGVCTLSGVKAVRMMPTNDLQADFIGKGDALDDLRWYAALESFKL